MQGKCVSDGIAIGKITVYRKSSGEVKKRKSFNAKSEIAAFNSARKQAKELIKARCEEAVSADQTSVELMNSYLVLIDDEEFIGRVKSAIRDMSKSASQAVIAVREELCELFGQMDDDYLKARAGDINTISDAILKCMSGKKKSFVITEESILFAEDLTPGETMQLDKSKILAFVTRRGSKLSHTAILAKSMGIPAVVGANYLDDCDGKLAIVDAYSGEVIIDPDEKTLKAYQDKQRTMLARAAELRNLIGYPTVTKAGKQIGLLANVGSIAEVKSAVENGCEGIGLFRSEFIYLDSDDYPSEEKQYQLYLNALKMLGDKELTIRTIDIGGDKQVPYMDMKPEENPAMGMRGIRYALGHKDVFKTQLRAILRVAAHGKVAILLPMVISIEEIWQIKSLIYEASEELEKRGEDYGGFRLGAMIETPAAVIIADLIAKEVDFLSIGTNDLTMYTLAVDRQNTELEFICDYYHQAVIRMLRMIINSGHEGGCKVCVCGELAADTSFTDELLKMGVDELSVSPTMLLRVKKSIRESNVG